MSNFTQWLAVHFSKEGIRVNAIVPGFFLTKQNEKLLFNEDGSPTARTGKILAATPVGRMGEPKDLEGALLFLVNNEAAGFITGVVLRWMAGFRRIPEYSVIFHIQTNYPILRIGGLQRLSAPLPGILLLLPGFLFAILRSNISEP